MVCLLAAGLIVTLGVELLAVTVSVSEFSFVGEPSDHISDDVVILNDDALAVSIQIDTVDWDRALDGVTRFYEAGTLERSCATWLSLSQHDASLASEAEVEIRLDLQVPEDARGTYWAGLLISASLDREGAEPGDINVLRQFLVRIYVTIPTANLSGRVSEMQIHGINPLGIEVSFANTGDTLLVDVVGLIVVESSTGASLFEIPLVPFDVLPGYSASQFVGGNWGLHIAGTYLIRAVLDFGAEYLVAGQSVYRLDELELTPIGAAVFPPADLNGDGLYEDVDGDGVLTAADTALLRNSFASPSIQDNARAFDFNNDGDVTVEDANVLQDIVLRTLD